MKGPKLGHDLRIEDLPMRTEKWCSGKKFEVASDSKARRKYLYERKESKHANDIGVFQNCRNLKSPFEKIWCPYTADIDLQITFQRFWLRMLYLVEYLLFKLAVTCSVSWTDIPTN
jgi:hypothetical protein